MIPFVTRQMLSADYWCAAMDQDILHHVYPVDKINRAVHAAGGLVDMRTLAGTVGNGRWVPPRPRPGTLPEGYDGQGQRRTAAWRAKVVANAEARASAHFLGFAVTRAALRAWPTAEPLFRSPEDRDFDQLMETRIAVFEPVVILGESVDGVWLWVQSQIYQGWVERQDVAWTDRETFFRFFHPERCAVVTRPRQVVEPRPDEGQRHPVMLGTGTILPAAGDVASVSGQEALMHDAVVMPARTADGSLAPRPGLIADGCGISPGFLPATRHNLLHAAFAMLGERYGWGDSFDRHDCSSLVLDVYRVLGIFLPRNSGAQRNAVGWRRDLQGDYAVRQADLRAALPGDLIFMPGHVMIYLGEEAHRPYVLHAFVGYREGGVVHKVNQVMVFPLNLTMRSAGDAYLMGANRVGAILAEGSHESG